MILDQHEVGCQPFSQPCQFCKLAEFLQKTLSAKQLGELVDLLRKVELNRQDNDHGLVDRQHQILNLFANHDKLSAPQVEKLLPLLPKKSAHVHLKRLKKKGLLEFDNSVVQTNQRFFCITKLGKEKVELMS